MGFGVMACEARLGATVHQRQLGGRIQMAGDGNEDSKGRTVRLGKHQAGFGDGNEAADLLGGFDPPLDDHFYVREGFTIRFALGRAARKFRHLGAECLVFLTPIDNHFVLACPL